MPTPRSTSSDKLLTVAIQSVHEADSIVLIPQPRWQRIARHQASSADLSASASTTTCCRHTTDITCSSWSYANGASIPQKSSRANTADGCPGRLEYGCLSLCRHRCTQPDERTQNRLLTFDNFFLSCYTGNKLQNKLKLLTNFE